ncbi:TetR/AcrR family transcriptional regulator [Streptomyces albidoflavus]|uniref:TetR/AcrR family transcriptional regulator n=1 Tax=Streptomyces albidoflavus TaxID=1886 RepID=UPI00345642AE
MRTLSRERLLEAAYELVAEKGLERLRMSQLAVAEAVEFTLTLAARNPLVRAMLTGGVHSGLPQYLATSSEAPFVTAEGAADAHVAETWPGIGSASRSLAVEAAVRLTASHVKQAGTTPQESARRIAECVSRIAGPTR